MCRMAIAQHPADSSIWVFLKRDSFTQISALHFTEVTNDVLLDWITPGYITSNADGNNGAEGEFPYLAASPDPTRNAILLAYQSLSVPICIDRPTLWKSVRQHILETVATECCDDPGGR